MRKQMAELCAFIHAQNEVITSMRANESSGTGSSSSSRTPSIIEPTSQDPSSHDPSSL
ncbi:hypothetical protein JOC55_001674 [Paenibacillus sacheonensis]|nr:hypothetical protein [Paenibacillus sacheonensis]